MRWSALIVFVSVILGLGVAEARPAAPPGSYQKTCSNAAVARGGVLTARCTDLKGKQVQAKLARVADCLGDIRNDNGALVCLRRSSLPAGHWPSTCRNFISDGKVLAAECRSADGRFYRTRVSLKGCDTALLNNDGRLVCDLPGTRPIGSWARACRIFAVTQGSLRAECLDSKGRWIGSVLRQNECRTGIGVTGEGRLACERKRIVPPGSWAASCPDFDVAGDTLSARCRDWEGGTRVSLVNWRRCGTTITNIGGTLVCDRDIEKVSINLPVPVTREASVYAPPGGWQRTCRAATVTGGRFAAECRDNRGRWRVSEIGWRSCRTGVENDNGRLVCASDYRRAPPRMTRIPPPPRRAAPPAYGDPYYYYSPLPADYYYLPEGNWYDSCRDVSVYGDWIYGQCLGWQGEWRSSEIRWTDCSSGIFNYGGALYCDTSWRPDHRRGNVPMPAGGWANTCRNASFDGYVLSAECRTQRGRWRTSGIDVRTCPYPISNDDGDLVCGAIPQQPTPAGSYAQSCRAVTWDGYYLVAECQDQRGRWQDSVLDTRSCTGDIGNRNGALICNSAPLPAGGWAQSCRNGVMNGTVLTAECLRASGQWAMSSVDTAQCDLPLANTDGQLTCTAPPVAVIVAEEAVPPGSYQQTCRLPAAAGGVLYAECLNSAGAYIAAALEYRGCQGDINNMAGILTCGGVQPLVSVVPVIALPAGSYQQSCQNAAISGDYLTAECVMPAGGTQWTSLPYALCSGDIYNESGALGCAGIPSQVAPEVAVAEIAPRLAENGEVLSGDAAAERMAEAMPVGDWAASCRNGTLAGGILSAECLNEAGAWIPTALPVADCADKEIVNANGQLVCEGFMAPAPEAAIAAATPDMPPPVAAEAPAVTEIETAPPVEGTDMSGQPLDPESVPLADCSDPAQAAANPEACPQIVPDAASEKGLAEPQPKVTPEATPAEVPVSEPTPAVTSEPTAVPTPEATPEATPESTPEATPEATPEPTPEPMPEATPEPTPEATPEPTPEATPEPAEEPTPEATPEPTPEATPEPTEEPTPEATPEPTPEATPEPTPEATPEPTPEATPEPEPEPASPPAELDCSDPANVGDQCPLDCNNPAHAEAYPDRCPVPQ